MSTIRGAKIYSPHLAAIGRLARDEGDELRHALLNALAGLLRDLALRTRDARLHDLGHVSDGEEAILLAEDTFRHDVVIIDIVLLLRDINSA
jgi:hypothetical protein